jgi:uncharacterized protein with HEPN domain
MSKRSDKEFLQNIGEAVQRTRAYVVGMTYSDYLQDTKAQSE